ncbi:HAD family hydrolase [Butyrivibrio sp. VCD2006]|uniref:HAD family hydrolase n=1 Tax=Butyrivibrio sp. VCD2006 TaxID=1280664 RepID=UPI0004003B98|nr:HAD family hydrolase [Butyrivibrio sp. VCD2006]
MKKVTAPLYKTYIFDLYGTLVDIRTDENMPFLWKNLAEIYSAYGADYTPAELEATYKALCDEETKLLLSEHKKIYPETVIEHPEIRLERVFARLLLDRLNTKDNSCDKPIDAIADKNGSFANFSKSHRTSATINGKVPSSLSIEELCNSEWEYMIANVFRILSRKWLTPYKNTLSTLKALRDKGCKTYLLSNAQGIFTRTELEVTGLLPFLDGIFISSEKQIKKPQPEFLMQLIDEYDIDKDSAVMVGNEMNCDMGIAKACDIPGIFLNTFNWSDKKIDKEMKKISINPDSIRIVSDGDIIHLLD